MSTSIGFWVAFHVGVFLALAIDLISFKRRDRELSMRAATLRSLIWVALSLAFNVLVWKSKGGEAGLDFLPVQQEAYDVCFSSALLADRRLQAFLTVVRSADYRKLLGELPGYSSAETGNLWSVN